MKINNLTILILTALISNQAYSSYRLPPKPDYYTGGEFSKEELNHFFDNYKEFTECDTLQQDEIDYLNLFNLNSDNIYIYNNIIEENIDKYLSYGHFSVLNNGVSKFDYDNIKFEKNNKYCQSKEGFMIPNSHIFIQDQYKIYKNYNLYEKNIDVKNKTLKIDEEVFPISFKNFNKEIEVSDSNFQRFEVIDLLGYENYNLENNKINSFSVINETLNWNFFYSDEFLNLKSDFRILNNFINSLFIKNINYDSFYSEGNNFNYFNLEKLYFVEEASFLFSNTNINLFNDKDSFNFDFSFSDSHVDSFDIKNVKYYNFDFMGSFSTEAIFENVDMISFLIESSTIKDLNYKGKIKELYFQDSFFDKINLDLGNEFFIENLSFSDNSINHLKIKAKDIKSTEFFNTKIENLNISGHKNQLAFDSGFVEYLDIEINKLDFESERLISDSIFITNSQIESIRADFNSINFFVFDNVYFKDNPSPPLFLYVDSLNIKNSIIDNDTIRLGAVNNLDIKNTYLKNKMFTFDIEGLDNGSDYNIGVNIDPSVKNGSNKTISFESDGLFNRLTIDLNLVKEYDSIFDNKLENINLTFSDMSKVDFFHLDSFDSDYNKNVNVNLFIPQSYNLKDFLYHYPNLNSKPSKHVGFESTGYQKNDIYRYLYDYREQLFNEASSYELDKKTKDNIKNKKIDFKSVSVFVNNDMDLREVSFDKDSYYCTDLYGIKEFLYIQKEDSKHYEDVDFYNDKEIEELKKSYDLIPKDKICK